MMTAQLVICAVELCGFEKEMGVPHREVKVSVNYTAIFTTCSPMKLSKLQPLVEWG